MDAVTKSSQEYMDKLGNSLEAVAPTTVPAVSVPADRIMLSTGVILKIRKVAPRMIVQALNRFEKPKVPVIYDKEKERSIENPQHPDYIKAMQDYQSEQGFAMFDICVALGTELDPTHPLKISSVQDNDWIDDLAAGGIEFDYTRPRLRYVMWVKTVAAPDPTDMEEIVRAVLRSSGVTQEDVSKALESFPGKT